MKKFTNLLTRRLKHNSEKPSKMTDLAELSAKGELSSFSGVFRSVPVTVQEQEKLHSLLTQFAPEDHVIETDLALIASITSEVKAIHHQASLLHGERINKVQEILKKYRDGAFSGWLLTTYGNRQTPYNFLHYYLLYQTLSQALKLKIDEMPRQAVYSLASRSGPMEKKEEIIQKYQGETKQELLALIRETFPLANDDRRNQDSSRFAILQLSRLHQHLKTRKFNPTLEQKREIQRLLKQIESAMQ